METIASLSHMSRESLSGLLLAQPPPSSLAIIDVRDDDHVGGHIKSSTWVPSSTLDYRMPELVRTLQGKETVVFHCALSQQRGPSAALRYLRERRRLLGDDGVEGKSTGEADKKKQQQQQAVYVLDGGFVKWQEKYGPDEKLTEKWARDIWQEGGP